MRENEQWGEVAVYSFKVLVAIHIYNNMYVCILSR